MKDKEGKLIHQGDIYWINFDPALGSEIKKKRPALVIQDHEVARHSQTVLVCPITSSARVHPFDVPIQSGTLEKNSRARVIQVKTCDLSRFLEFHSHLDQQTLQRVFAKLFILLGF